MNSPSRKPCRQTSRSSKATILLHILLIVEFILPLLGEKTIETVTAAPILPVQARSIGKQANTSELAVRNALFNNSGSESIV